MWLNANISCCVIEVNKLSNLLFYLEILIIFTVANQSESSEMITFEIPTLSVISEGNLVNVVY